MPIRRPRDPRLLRLLRPLLLAPLLVACDDGASAPPPTTDAAVSDAQAIDQNVDDGLFDQAIHDQTVADLGAPDLAAPDLAAPDMAPPDLGPPPPLPEPVEPPACDVPVARGTALPGPLDPGHDAALAAKALRIERVFHAVSAWGHGANADLSFADAAGRAAIEAFAAGDAWQLDAPPPAASFGKIAGLYGGVGIAADAWRYLDLRDSGAPCAAVERARAHLRADLETLHRASAITGTPGVIARALARTDLPGAGQSVPVPLFAADGSPLPAEKNNGTWRADASGLHPGWVWEDSCSRDMYVGWALAYAAVWEAIRTDPAFEAALKDRLRADATALLDSLMVVRAEGYDLEIRDSDGRRTYHGILNESSVDRVYAAGVPNGFNAYMAVGIVAGLAYVTADPRHLAYLHGQLINARGLLRMARDSLLGVDLGIGSNYSAYNMAFTAGWLAMRYLQRAEDRALARDAALAALYQRPERARQPAEQDQALYDLVAYMAQSGGSAFEPGAAVDTAPLRKVQRILTDFPAAPFFAEAVINCDPDELEAGACEGIDGTPLPLADSLGRGDIPVAAVPVPMRIRPPSNYFWRSNPYQVNGEGRGLELMPAVDFRVVYWGARALQVR